METTSEGLTNFLNHYGAIPTLVTAEAGEMPTKSQQLFKVINQCENAINHIPTRSS